MDYENFSAFAALPVTPDVLVTPSELRFFIKVSGDPKPPGAGAARNSSGNSNGNKARKGLGLGLGEGSQIIWSSWLLGSGWAGGGPNPAVSAGSPPSP